VILQAHTQPVLRLERTRVAPASKQLRNRVPKQTCLQRRAGVRARYKNSGYGQLKGGQNHSQVNDLWACFEVPEWRAFCHTERM